MSRVVTANDVKIMSEEERKAKRAEKFGVGDKLQERAKRFGAASGNDKPAAVSNANVLSSVDSERLKKRAERFGVVSDVVKKIDENEKLNKRKQRFNAANNSSNAVTDEVKRKRLERFSNKPLESNSTIKTLTTKTEAKTTTLSSSPKAATTAATTTTAKNNGQSSEANKVS